MGEVTPGRPIRRHCHYKHPSGKNRTGDKQTPNREKRNRESSVLAGSGPPAYQAYLLTYCASFLPGITGCKVRWMAPWAVGSRGSVAISAGIRVARKRPSPPVRPPRLPCLPFLFLD